MKYTFLIIFLCFVHFGQSQDNYEITDSTTIHKDSIIFYPEFGGYKYINTAINEYSNRLDLIIMQFKGKDKAINNLVEVANERLSTDPMASLKNYNLAYLIDSTNSQVYNGFGDFYLNQKDFQSARAYYNKGLYLNPKDHKIQTSIGDSYYLEYISSADSIRNKNTHLLSNAIRHFEQSDAIKKNEPENIYYLSRAHMMAGNCEKSKEFLDIGYKLPNSKIPIEHWSKVKVKCPQENLRCNGLRSGTFSTKHNGNIIIKRENDIQIETNNKYGTTVKYKVDWVKPCVYELIPLHYKNGVTEELESAKTICYIVERKNTTYVVESTNIDHTKWQEFYLTIMDN